MGLSHWEKILVHPVKITFPSGDDLFPKSIAWGTISRTVAGKTTNKAETGDILLNVA
jgi:hypothetical protein